MPASGGSFERSEGGDPMRLRLLGSSAGGGLPQWNCACPNCAAARAGEPGFARRTGDSLAFSADGSSWYVINASPDISVQLEAIESLHPSVREGPRNTPIRGVLLTDAELDHTLGLLQLRQGAKLDIYAAPPVLEALSSLFPVRRMVEPYAEFTWQEMRPGVCLPFFEGTITVSPFRLGGKPPRYAARSNPERAEESDWVVGIRLYDAATGGTAVYAPGVESWSPELESKLAEADLVLLDGTFWRSDELRSLGIGECTAAEMGHVPLSGPGGTLSRLAGVTAARKVLVHLNNTNPILRADSRERLEAKRLGVEIGYDGWEAEV
jgi:pyrroloquinoline quinone biosynthesis protein B